MRGTREAGKDPSDSQRGTREAPGRSERTIWTAWEAPGRRQGGRKGSIGQPVRHQGGTREAGKNQLHRLGGTRETRRAGLPIESRFWKGAGFCIIFNTISMAIGPVRGKSWGGLHGWLPVAQTGLESAARSFNGERPGSRQILGWAPRPACGWLPVAQTGL